MKKFWNFIKNEDTSETELLFNGPISEDTWWGDEVTPALFRDELAKVSGNLTVWLNSPGGDVFAASQIYSMLKNHKGKVTGLLRVCIGIGQTVFRSACRIFMRLP